MNDKPVSFPVGRLAFPLSMEMRTQRGFAGNLVSQALSGPDWRPMSVPALTPRSALSGVALLRARLSGRHSGGSDAGSQAVISAGIRRTGCSAHFP